MRDYEDAIGKLKYAVETLALYDDYRNLAVFSVRYGYCLKNCE